MVCVVVAVRISSEARAMCLHWSVALQLMSTLPSTVFLGCPFVLHAFQYFMYVSVQNKQDVGAEVLSSWVTSFLTRVIPSKFLIED